MVPTHLNHNERYYVDDCPALLLPRANRGATQNGESCPFCEPIFGHLEDVTKKSVARRHRDLSKAIILPFLPSLLLGSNEEGWE